VLTALAEDLRRRGKVDLTEAFGAPPAQEGGVEVGVTRRGKATKIMAMADHHGLPVAVWTASAERHETKLVHQTLDARFVKPLPKKLIGVRAYDSNILDAELAARGVEMVAPHHRTRTPRRRPARLYAAIAAAGMSSGCSLG
jgi:hypothetical protein